MLLQGALLHRVLEKADYGLTSKLTVGAGRGEQP
jgi:hypothetical protein